jgi:hypothetical protein
MKRAFQICVAVLLLGSLTFSTADPLKTWSWTDPTTYENNTPIPGGDLILRTLHCSNNPGDPDVPYPNRYEASVVFAMQAPPSIEDMAFIVAGLAGDYYCSMTVGSLAHNSTSRYSNEIFFSVTSGQLGLVPKAITDLALT